MGLWEPLFFWIFAVGAVGSSAAVIAFRNPLYSAIALILDFFFFAGLYGLLSAHFLAVIQILVYAGAIMVLFLFIIMLLNLTDDELGTFEFRLHHILSAVAAAGFLLYAVSAFLPMMNSKLVRDMRGQSEARQEQALKKYQELKKEAEAEQDPALRAEKMRTAKKARRVMHVARTPVPGLALDLNETALEQAYQQKIKAFDTGRTSPAQGKWRRFDDTRPMVVPPVMTGKGLTTEEGKILPSEPASFGTVEPISILIVNRFVVPFELTAILLLAAIIGAVIIAKRRL